MLRGLQGAPQPLAPETADRFGCPAHSACPHVKASAKSHAQAKSGEQGSVLQAPPFLGGKAEADEQDIRLCRTDFSEKCVVFRPAFFKISVVATGDAKPGVTPPQILSRRFGNAGLAAEQKERKPTVGGTLHDPLGGVDPGDTFPTALPEQAGGKRDADTVRKQEGGTVHLPDKGRFPGARQGDAGVGCEHTGTGLRVQKAGYFPAGGGGIVNLKIKSENGKIL